MDGTAFFCAPGMAINNRVSWATANLKEVHAPFDVLTMGFLIRGV